MLYTVHVHVRGESLMARMSEMRVWLDAHGYEPDLFQYHTQAQGALVRVDFKFENEAFAFAEALGGGLLR